MALIASKPGGSGNTITVSYEIFALLFLGADNVTNIHSFSFSDFLESLLAQRREIER